MVIIYIKKLSTFNNIKNKKKIIEGRLYKGIFKSLKKNDLIEFCFKDEKIKANIIDINKYKDFREMLIVEGIQNLLPNIYNIEEGINIYNTYYPNRKNKNVLSIKFNVNY